MASIRKHQTKDGKIKFYVQIRLKGHAPQTANFDRLTDARNWIQEVESSIRNNRYFKTAESRKHDFNQLADRYIASVLPEKKTASDQKAQLFWWKKHIGNMLLADITPSLISEYKEKLLTEKTKKGKKAHRINSKSLLEYHQPCFYCCLQRMGLDERKSS